SESLMYGVKEGKRQRLLQNLTYSYNDLLDNVNLNIQEQSLLIAIISYLGSENAHPSYKTLKRRSKIANDRTLIKTINSLEQKKIIEINRGKGILKALKFGADIKKAIDVALKLEKEDGTKMTIEDIKNSISNYAQLCNLGLFTYQWRLIEFLKRRQKDTNIPQLLLFLDNGTTYINCMRGLSSEVKSGSNIEMFNFDD
ncbi:helix-turn-helix domain-containing protein, partial [Clostridium sp. WILCCON 0269]